MSTPIVSILLPIYNSEKYVSKAIKSILAQSFQDFELLLINDGSTDKSIEIMRSFNDSRIRIIDNGKNRGIVYSLNSGINNSKGIYLARMDADDISLKDRILIQVNYLNKNPEIDILGSNYELFGAENHTTNLNITPDKIKTSIFFDNQLCHPSIIMRKSSIIKNQLIYNKNFFINQDWVLWFDALNKNLKIANLPNVLIKYRLEGQNITTNNKDSEKRRSINVYKHMLVHLFENLSNKDLELHWALSKGDVTNIEIKELKKYSEKLKLALIKKGFKEIIIDEIIQTKQKNIFYKITDKSTLKGITFLISNHLFSLTTIKYLLSRLIKGTI